MEYWSRQEWKHIEAHADVDEKLAAGGGPLRYPEHGHVLYLEVGPKVQGPTCVWEGGAFDGAMTTVPAVPGRVLRFQGKLQHAVPRPADVWLSPFVISQSGSAEDFVRSVVLFNCWEEPPLDVTADEVPLLDGNGDALMQITSNPRKLWKTAEPQPAAALWEGSDHEAVAPRRQGAARSNGANTSHRRGSRGCDDGPGRDGGLH